MRALVFLVKGSLWVGGGDEKTQLGSLVDSPCYSLLTRTYLCRSCQTWKFSGAGACVNADKPPVVLGDDLHVSPYPNEFCFELARISEKHNIYGAALTSVMLLCNAIGKEAAETGVCPEIFNSAADLDKCESRNSMVPVCFTLFHSQGTRPTQPRSPADRTEH